MSVTTKNISLNLAEDAWNGDAQAIISVDGNVVFSGTATALNNLNTVANPNASVNKVNLGDYDASVNHVINVQFTNDAYGGTTDTDRNLYVKDVLIDGVSTGEKATLLSNGVATFNYVPSSSNTVATVLSTDPGRDSITLSLSQDAYLEDAQFAVFLNGQQVGGVQTVSANHSAGQTQDFTFATTISLNPKTVSVKFLNDAYNGPGQDRNLYLDSVKVNGNSLALENKVLYANGQIDAQVPSIDGFFHGYGLQTIGLQMSEDSYLGDAKAVISVDGVNVDQTLVSVLHSTGTSQLLNVKGNFGTGQHTIGVSFVNDFNAGSPGTDRNLYVQSVSLNGNVISNGEYALMSNGTYNLTGSFEATAPVVPVVFVPVVPVVPVVLAPVTPVVPVVLAPVVPVVTAPVAPVVPVIAGPVPTSFGADSTVGLVDVTAPVIDPSSRILTVGLDKQYQKIADAINNSKDGDSILVDAGTYTNDFAIQYSKVALYAVGGRVIMDATVPPPDYKGIITSEADLKVVGFDFTNSRIPDEFGHNGAGIRVDYGNLTLINDRFAGNQDGILTNAGKNISVTIDHTVFDGNGGNDGNGAGNIHNVYIGDVSFAKATNSIFENALVGHEFKSRAETNTLNNNLFISGVGTGTGSYDIDIPDGGKTIITNNTIIKGVGAPNHTMIHFGGENIPYAGSTLAVSGNFFQATGPSLGIQNSTSVTAKVSNNKIDGVPYEGFIVGPAKVTGTYDVNGKAYADQSLTGIIPGSTQAYLETDTAPHTYSLDGTTQARGVVGGAGLLTLSVQIGHVGVQGGSGGMNLTEVPLTTGGNTFSTTSGSTNSFNLLGVGGDIIDSEGNDTILTGDGNAKGLLAGNTKVVAGLGDNQWSIAGTVDYTLGLGSSFFTISPDATLNINGTGPFYKVSNNGGSITMNSNSGGTVSGSIKGGAFDMQVYGGVAHLFTAAGADGALVRMGEGTLTGIIKGSDEIYAGSGSTSLQVRSNAIIHAGTGDLSVYARGYTGASVYSNGGTVLLGGDTGGITYYGDSKDNTVLIEVGHTTVIGGSGRVFATGSGSITGGTGGVNFTESEGGAVSLTTVAGSTSLITLVGGGDQIDSSGTDVITSQVSNSNYNIRGDSTLSIKGGNSQINLYGKDVLNVESGYDHINAMAGSDVQLNLNELHTLHESSSNVVANINTASGIQTATISGGEVDAYFNSSSDHAIAIQSHGGSNISVTGSSAISSSGNDVIKFNGGSSSVTINDNGGTEVHAGSGSLNASGNYNSGNFSLYADSANVVAGDYGSGMKFIGGSGSAVLSGEGIIDIVGGSGSISTGAGNYGQNIHSFVGGSGNADLHLGGNGADITFGAGSTHVSELGYGSADTFHATMAMASSNFIDNFRVGTDKLVLDQGVQIVSDGYRNGGSYVSLNNGQDINFTGVASVHNLFA